METRFTEEDFEKWFKGSQLESIEAITEDGERVIINELILIQSKPDSKGGAMFG